ncbi:glycosyltransferase family 39 protein [Geobacter sp. DSM 9736]|uniref:ArnT family glycosyltransferase n=1 Tax=Geobacter sp. DSM 9736 TaxID=1277350 RepID=UPI000B509BC3|nr:glycosyltransferase family 39 protein [Geobacter sp. DSM 9736]SNB48117.1 Dolichyl-phosphate-mannose-protein mannosyltransferase [Geobacter sp. DSM 9736]
MKTACAAESRDFFRVELFLFILIAFLLVGLRLCFLHEPFERDEGFYSVIGREILRGGIPYRDAIDMKPPGVFYIYAFAIAVFGKTVESIRIFTALYSVLTLGAVYWLARYLSGRAAALAAAAIFALYSGAPLLQGSSSNSEVFMVLPLMLSACFFAAAAHRQRPVLLVASGFCMALAMLIKTVALPYLLLLLVCSIFVGKKEEGFKGRILNPVLFLSPCILVGLATLAYFYLNGAWDDFVMYNITLPLFYSKGGGVVGPELPEMIRYLSHEFLLPVLLAVPTAVWLLIRRESISLVMAALLLVASWLGVIMPGKNFPHYFIQLMPFLSLLGGIGLAKVLGNRRISLILAVPLSAAFLYYAVKDYRLYFVLPPEDVSILKYGPVFADSVKVADYLKKNTAPGDYIFQWGFEPELYFLADRPIPTPYISSTIPASLPDTEAAVNEMIRMLKAKKPKVIVMQKEWAKLPGLVELSDLLMKEYRMDTIIRYAAIFTRRTGG